MALSIDTGNVASKIVEFSQENDVDLIVMGRRLSVRQRLSCPEFVGSLFLLSFELIASSLRPTHTD